MPTKGANTGVSAVKPIATSALDREKTYNDARAADSLTVVLAADCNTKCSVTSADMNAVCLVCSSIPMRCSW